MLKPPARDEEGSGIEGTSEEEELLLLMRAASSRTDIARGGEEEAELMRRMVWCCSSPAERIVLVSLKLHRASLVSGVCYDAQAQSLIRFSLGVVLRAICSRSGEGRRKEEPQVSHK